MNWLDQLERADPAYRGAYVWHCPDCGAVLGEGEEGMCCHGCDRQWSWAELRASESGD
jgi:hypothetical protein